MKTKKTIAYNTQNGFSKLIVVITFIILTVIAGSLIYFFSIRQSNGEYQSAATQVSSLKSISLNISSNFNVKSPLLINLGTTKSILQSVNTYQQAIDAFASSKVLSRDTVVRAEYDKDQKIIQAYGTLVENIFESVNTYSAIKLSCNNIIQADNIFMPNGTISCDDALKKADTIPNSDLKRDFLDNFVSQVKKLNDATTQKANKATLTSLRLDVERTVLAEGIIDYALPTSPVDTYDNLAAVITQRKDVLFR